MTYYMYRCYCETFIRVPSDKSIVSLLCPHCGLGLDDPRGVWAFGLVPRGDEPEPVEAS